MLYQAVIVKGQSETLQGLFGDLDRDFIVPRVLQIDLCDVGETRDRIANSLAVDLERLLGRVCADRDLENGPSDFDVADDGFLCLDRKGRDRVDCVLDE